MFQESEQDQELQDLKNCIINPDVVYKTSRIHNLYVKGYEGFYLFALVDFSVTPGNIITWWRQTDGPSLIQEMAYQRQDGRSDVHVSDEGSDSSRA